MQKLTTFSKGAGCGCKLAPSVLKSILSNQHAIEDNNLLVGNKNHDDAAVYKINDTQALISTTDFFMPIVDDAYSFGAIAACNAISDVYAMGGKPLTALAILGWPIAQLPAEIASDVIKGATEICKQAGISISGGHSIDNLEPLFGLAVTGIVDIPNIKKNNTAQVGDLIYITKPIGAGLVTTALKSSLAKEEDVNTCIKWMTTLNEIGYHLGQKDYVSALTDITGFGVIGHLSEVCEGSKVSAIVDFNKIPLMDGALSAIEFYSIPNATNKNFETYKDKTNALSPIQKNILYDPQTSGGLLVCIQAASKNKFELLMKEHACFYACIGETTILNETLITITES